MDLEDLAAHNSEFVEPVFYTYGQDLKVYEVSGKVL